MNNFLVDIIIHAEASMAYVRNAASFKKRLIIYHRRQILYGEESEIITWNWLLLVVSSYLLAKNFLLPPAIRTSNTYLWNYFFIFIDEQRPKFNNWDKTVQIMAV